MNKITKIYFKTVILFTALCTTSCLSFQENELVLEKSSKDTPHWIAQNSSSHVSNDSISLVYKKTDLYNLYLGLKQAQAAATLQTSFLIMHKIQNDLTQKIAISPTHNKKKRETIVSNLSHVIRENWMGFKSQPAVPKEIYWEYRQRDTDNGPERFYTVWVLLTVPKLDYESALLHTARNLIKSEQKDIVDLGQNILQQMSPR